MAPTSSNTELTKWSAANAKDRIAIVTTDAALDARIRAALRNEDYEFVTVPDFETHQNCLTDTILGIFDARGESIHKTLKFIRMSVYWSEYAMVGIYTKEELDTINNDIMLYRFSLDVEIAEDFIEEELASWLKRLIKVLREPDKLEYHTI